MAACTQLQSRMQTNVVNINFGQTRKRMPANVFVYNFFFFIFFVFIAINPRINRLADKLHSDNFSLPQNSCTRSITDSTSASYIKECMYCYWWYGLWIGEHQSLFPKIILDRIAYWCCWQSVVCTQFHKIHFVFRFLFFVGRVLCWTLLVGISIFRMLFNVYICENTKCDRIVVLPEN